MASHPSDSFNIDQFSSQLEKIFIVLLFFYFALNFLASPYLKYLYLAFPFIISLSLIVAKPKNTITLFLLYLWIEGQGRVIWGYVWWARIIFDMLMAWALIKEFLIEKKLFQPSGLPIWIKGLVSIHFLIFFFRVI